MKTTNISWIPSIPDNWNVVRLKDIAKLQSGESITSDNIDAIGEYPVFGGNGLRGYTDAYTNEGDYVLIGRQGALCGNINYAKGKFFASEHAVVVYTYDKNENTTWLGETLRAANFNRLSASAAQPGLAVGVLNFQKIPFPPKDVRKKIGIYLDEKLSAITFKVIVLPLPDAPVISPWRFAILGTIKSSFSEFFPINTLLSIYIFFSFQFLYSSYFVLRIPAFLKQFIKLLNSVLNSL